MKKPETIQGDVTGNLQQQAKIVTDGGIDVGFESQRCRSAHICGFITTFVQRYTDGNIFRGQEIFYNSYIINTNKDFNSYI